VVSHVLRHAGGFASFWSAGEDVDDPAALYGGDTEIVLDGQPGWYSIEGYSYGINDWRGNEVAENQRRRLQPTRNDIPLDDVTPRTGNGSAVVLATTTTTTASHVSVAASARSVQPLIYTF